MLLTYILSIESGSELHLLLASISDNDTLHISKSEVYDINTAFY